MSEIPDAIPSSPFRCAIPNPKRYMKFNKVSLEKVCLASMEGNLGLLEEMLSTGNEDQLFNGDLNAFYKKKTALQHASKTGQTECVVLLLKAKADPHMKENVPEGMHPEDGKTAAELAQDEGWDDVVTMLQNAEKSYPYGFYMPTGPANNTKCYGVTEFGSKPEKNWYMSRPGASVEWGLDPAACGDELWAKKKKKMLMPIGPPPLPIGLLFPGQGSQYVKMMTTVKDIPAVKDMLAKAKTILGYDVLDLCLSGPEDKLEETKTCQPVMFIAGLAGVEKLRGEREEAVERAQVLGGLSLGEYTALCVAGVFSFEDGLKLVQTRGAAMDEAAKIGKQAMLSVAGLEKAKLEDLCAQAAKAESSGVCQIANELFPKGFSCAGTEPSILKLKELAEGAGALQAKVLKTSGGFHTSLMKPAQTKLGKALDDALPAMSPPTKTVYMNATGEPVKPGTDPKEIVELLKRQLTSRVLWEPCVRAMIREGVSEFYEVGPMKQIKAMMKRIDSKVWNTTTNVEV